MYDRSDFKAGRNYCAAQGYNSRMENPIQLRPRFIEAVDYARHVHVELRKGTQVPYMAHLLGVASLVLGETGHIGPHMVTEDMVIAALLHDAVEDEGGLPRLHDIEEKFGKEVAKIVEGCSDSFEQDPNKKQVWEVRKASYIERLWNEPPASLLVSIADKLYNARAILEEYRQLGAEVWTRFKRGRKHQLWYFDELIKVFERRCRIGGSSKSSSEPLKNSPNFPPRTDDRKTHKPRRITVTDFLALILAGHDRLLTSIKNRHAGTEA